MYRKVIFMVVGVLLMTQFGMPPIPDGVVLAQNNDQIVYAGGKDGHHQLYIMDANGSNPHVLTSQGDNTEPSWSPSRRTIAFTSNNSGISEIYVINSDGSGEQQVSNGGGYSASWSPDGQRLAFISDRMGGSQLYVMGADGSNVQQLTNDPNGQASSPAWSPDGQTIAFVYDQNGLSAIWLIKADGSNLHRLTHDPMGEDYGTAWSPNGQHLAYASTVGGDSDLLMVDANGSNEVQVASLASKYAGNLTWSPDGTQLAFMAWARHGAKAIFVVAADGSGDLRQLSQGSDDEGWPSWSSLPFIEVTNPPTSLSGTSELTGIVDTGRLNMRNGPGIDYDQVGRITNGDTVTLIGRDTIGWWVQIHSDAIGVTGWVSARYLLVTPDILALPITFDLPGETSPSVQAGSSISATVQSGDGTLNIRNGPGTNYGVIASLSKGNQVVLTGRNGSASWVQISGYDSGWVSSRFLTFDGNLITLPISNSSASSSNSQTSVSTSTNTNVGHLLTGGRGLVNGAALPPGEFQVEYYCNRQGYGVTHNNSNWYCTHAGKVVQTLRRSDFDRICQETYHNSQAYAVQRGSNIPAYNWHCYGP